MSLGAGKFGGQLMKENCTLNTQQGEPWAYTNQTSKYLLIGCHQFQTNMLLISAQSS